MVKKMGKKILFNDKNYRVQRDGTFWTYYTYDDRIKEFNKKITRKNLKTVNFENGNYKVYNYYENIYNYQGKFPPPSGYYFFSYYNRQ